MPSSSRKTATLASIVAPSSALISETRRPACSRPTIASIRASSSVSSEREIAVEAAALGVLGARPRRERRPKISVSSSELAPSRLPPWTETQATSPAA